MLRFTQFTLVIILCGSTVQAQQSYPMLMSIQPVAAQAGNTSEHLIKSRYSMEGAYQIMVSGDGVTGEALLPEPKPGEKQSALQALKVRFAVAADALPGVRDVRVATPAGVSTVGQLVIVTDPVIAESKDNDNPAGATACALPATLCGRIEKAEDVDYFRFQAGAGDTLCFHVRCMSLQDRIHDLQTHADPIVAIRTVGGSTIAAADNSLGGDPFLCHTFRDSGEYLLEIRDVRFLGNDYWEYCIEVNQRPFVQAVFPLASNAERGQLVKLVGYGVSDKIPCEISLPSTCGVGVRKGAVNVGENVKQLVSMVVDNGPLHCESSTENGNCEQAEPIEIPGGINGCIETETDIDCFAFEAKQGERFTMDLVARRADSALDSYLRILNSQGKQVQVNDDLRDGKRGSADSRIENWTVPADGRYYVEVRDLHLRGGPAFVYYLKATRCEPHFSLYADTDKTTLTPGTSGVIFVRAERKNGFDGEIQLHVDGLPPHVSASCGRILPGKPQDGCIVLTADSDAPLDVANARIWGEAKISTAEDDTQIISADATVYQEIYQPGGGRGHWPVQHHAVSVGAPSDVRAVTLNTHELTLKAGESTTIDVDIERASGFDKNVLLEVTYSHLNSVYGDPLPAGVTVDAANSTTLLTNGATQGKIRLKAAPDAQLAERQQITVMANISINFVMKVTYASQPVFLTVTK